MKKHLLSFLAVTALSFFGQLPNLSLAQALPDKALLNELETYSNQTLPCSEFACNAINHIKFDIVDGHIVTSLSVSSRQSSFITLPFKREEVKLISVLLDGKNWYQIIDSNAQYKIGVPQGEHTLSIKLLMNSSMLSLTGKFPNVEVSSGLSINERNGSSVISMIESKSSTLTKTNNENTNNDNSTEKSSYPTEAFYQVSRTLYLHNSWKLMTQITPLFDTTKSTTLEIALLKGEKILNSDIKVENDKAIVNLSNQPLSWESTLSPVNQLDIPAVQTSSYSQVFSLQSSNLWNSSVKGKNPFQINGDMTSWALWNGEKLTLDFKAPIVLPGKTLSLDQLNISYHKEHDTHFYQYSLTANTSLAGKIFFTLPPDYLIENLTINNKAVNIDKTTKKVPVDLNFGTNTIAFNISTQENQTFYKTFPYVQFPETVYNTHYTLDSEDWILYSGGSDIHTEYILFSSLIFLCIITFLTKKMNPHLHIMVIGFILLGFLQNSLQIMLLLPILLALIKFKNVMIVRFEKNTSSFEYNVYQFLLIAVAFMFMFSFLVTLKLGLLDSPSSWTLYGQNRIDWFNEIYSSQPIWFLQLDSIVYHLFMFAWAIFVSYHLIHISKLIFQSVFAFELWVKKQPVVHSIVQPVVQEVVDLPDSEKSSPPDSNKI